MSASITLSYMKFKNILSYAGESIIHFADNPVTQLVGKNGAGKSSIATILEEALYNKNSRGIKKDELFNWSSDSKHYSIEVGFNAGADKYTVYKDVKSTAKVALFKNDEDISGHTATQTYKLIEDIIGCDFTTFTKLVYQSIGSSLDFLRTTDANRKAFLTGLFSHEIYKELSESVKKDAKDVKSELDVFSGKLSAIQTVISRSNNSELVEQSLVEVPEYDDTEDQSKVSDLKVKVALANKMKAKITRIKCLDETVQAAEETFEPYKDLVCTDNSKEISAITVELRAVTNDAEKVKTRYKGFKSQAEKCNCPTCGKELDVSDAVKAADIAREEFIPLAEQRNKLQEQLSSLEIKQKEFTILSKAKSSLESALKARSDYLEASGDIESILVDIPALELEISNISSGIRKSKAEVELALEHNNTAKIVNAKNETIRKQLEEANKDLEKLTESVNSASQELADLNLLANSFKELVAYKLEHSVKVFEDYINKYLSILTGGKFALGFDLDATKLLVVIYNDGKKTSITSCSTGQQHRIQLATLLAIRSLMSVISKVNINVLFLDEVISFIDPQGINTLVELLNEEHELNSFLVSHGHQHPLAKIITVEQDHNGNSRLE